MKPLAAPVRCPHVEILGLSAESGWGICSLVSTESAFVSRLENQSCLLPAADRRGEGIPAEAREVGPLAPRGPRGCSFSEKPFLELGAQTHPQLRGPRRGKQFTSFLTVEIQDSHPAPSGAGAASLRERAQRPTACLALIYLCQGNAQLGAQRVR